jgi:hypothetical protein
MRKPKNVQYNDIRTSAQVAIVHLYCYTENPFVEVLQANFSSSLNNSNTYVRPSAGNYEPLRTPFATADWPVGLIINVEFSVVDCIESFSRAAMQQSTANRL